MTAAAALTVACSLTSLDGLSGGPSDTPRPADDARAGDAAADAVADAPPRADDAGTDAFTTSCATAPTGAFCDDFELGLVNWEIKSSAGNAMVLDALDSVSPTHSALSMVASPGMSCLSRTFLGSPTTIEVEADVRVDAQSLSGANYDMFALGASGAANLAVQLRLGVLEFDEDILLGDGGKEEKFTTTDYKVDAAWHHIRWTNQLGPTTAEAVIYVDGTRVGSTLANPVDFKAPLLLELGDCTISSVPWKIRFDNVVVVTK